MYESDHDVEYWTRMAERLTDLIAEEDQKWKQLGLHPGMLNINAHLIQMKVNTLIKLIRRLGISEEEIEALFKESVLEQLENDRKMLLEAKKRAANPEIAVPRRNLLGPNGQPII